MFKYGDMIHFPITIADNFYDDPDAIRNFALSLEYEKDPRGDFPGVRTRPLYQIDPKLDGYCVGRFLNLFFDINFTKFDELLVITQFQLIDPMDPDKDHVKNKSWIHIDAQVGVAGVVYLTPDADLDSGTSFYQPKKDAVVDLNVEERRMLHTTGNIDDRYIAAHQVHSDMFIETASTKNVYNRIVAYDSNVFHGASNHHAGTQPRLTQTFFVVKLKTTSKSSLDRLRMMPRFQDIVNVPK
jgi:hypothetical protein